MIVENCSVGSLSISDLNFTLENGEIRDISFITQEKIDASMGLDGSLNRCLKDNLVKIALPGSKEHESYIKKIAARNTISESLDCRKELIKFFQLHDIEKQIRLINSWTADYYDVLYELRNKDIDPELLDVVELKYREIKGETVSSGFILL